MPTYQYRCAGKHVTTKICPVRDYEEAVSCDECDLVAVRIFTPPVMVKAAPDLCYDSPIDGKPITTHAARHDDLKRNGCIPYDPEMKKDAARKQRERQDTLESSIEETVCREVAKMPRAKKAKLASELIDQGVDAQVVRS